MDLNLNISEVKERKFLGLSDTDTLKIPLNRDQETAIGAISTAGCGNLWFKGTQDVQKLTKFSAAPPKLYWPELCTTEDISKDVCSQCLDGKIFFTSLGVNYLRSVYDMESSTRHIKVKPLCLQMVMTVEFYKKHGISELANHILKISDPTLSDCFKNELKVWIRLNKYILQMGKKCEKLKKSLLESTKSFRNNMEYHLLKGHLDEGSMLLAQCEKRIEEMSWNDEKIRILKNPKGFKNRVRFMEELYINRISNAAIMSEWMCMMANKDSKLNKRDHPYLFTAFRSSSFQRFRNHSNLASLIVDQLPLKCCNFRHQWISPVIPYLPPPISHLFAFTVGIQVEEIHPSWFRTLLDASARAKFNENLQIRNRELKSGFIVLESEMERGEIVNNMKMYFTNQSQDCLNKEHHLVS